MITLHFNLMGPLLYMQSVVDQSVVMQCMTVLSWLLLAVRIETRSRVVSADGHNYGLVVQTVTGIFLASAENYVQNSSQAHPAFFSVSTRDWGMNLTTHCYPRSKVSCCKKGNTCILL